MIVIKDEPMDCTSESIKNSTSGLNATNSEKTIIQLDKLKLVPSSQNVANSSLVQFFLAEGEKEMVVTYCAKVGKKEFDQNC